MPLVDAGPPWTVLVFVARGLWRQCRRFIAWAGIGTGRPMGPVRVGTKGRICVEAYVAASCLRRRHWLAEFFWLTSWSRLSIVMACYRYRHDPLSVIVWAPAFGLTGSATNDLRIYLEASEAWLSWSETLVDERRTEHWRQCPANVVAEGEADRSSTSIWYPVPLSYQCASCDRVREFFQASVGRQRLCGCGLYSCQILPPDENGIAYLGML